VPRSERRGIAAAWLARRYVRGRLVDWTIAAADRSPAWFYAVAFPVTLEFAYMFESTRYAAHAIRDLLGGGSFQTAVLITAALAAIVVATVIGALDRLRAPHPAESAPARAPELQPLTRRASTRRQS